MPPDPSIVADHRLDCTGLVCPVPVLRLRKAVEAMKVGEILEMTATDVATVVDVQAWTRRTGHELLQYTEQSGLFKFYIKKAH